MMTRRTRRATHFRRGVAAAEFAVCLPVIVLLVLAMIESCTMIFLKQSVTIAAYEGARIAVSENPTVADVRQASQQVIADRGVQNATITITPNNFRALAVGEYIEISVSAPANDNSVIPGNFFLGKTLTGKARMMKEFE